MACPGKNKVCVAVVALVGLLMVAVHFDPLRNLSGRSWNQMVINKFFRVVPPADIEPPLPEKNAVKLVAPPELKLEKGQKIMNSLRKDGIAYNLAGADIDQMTDHQLAMTLHSYLDNADTICWRKLRMGRIGDGGWEVCDDPDVRPSPPCTVYSFGINNEWSFDDNISSLYGCHVFSFDPSMEQESHDRSDLIHFYNWGIDGNTEIKTRTMTKGGKKLKKPKLWQMYTLQDIRKKLGHESKTINVLKMDVESSEWPALPNMVATGQLKGVRQLLMEYHVTGRNDLRSKVKTIQEVEKEGFRKFLVHKNFYCARDEPDFPVTRTSCYEIHYVKRE